MSQGDSPHWKIICLPWPSKYAIRSPALLPQLDVIRRDWLVPLTLCHLIHELAQWPVKTLVWQVGG